MQLFFLSAFLFSFFLFNDPLGYWPGSSESRDSRGSWENEKANFREGGSSRAEAWEQQVLSCRDAARVRGRETWMSWSPRKAWTALSGDIDVSPRGCSRMGEARRWPSCPAWTETRTSTDPIRAVPPGLARASRAPRHWPGEGAGAFEGAVGQSPEGSQAGAFPRDFTQGPSPVVMGVPEPCTGNSPTAGASFLHQFFLKGLRRPGSSSWGQKARPPACRARLLGQDPEVGTGCCSSLPS